MINMNNIDAAIKAELKAFMNTNQIKANQLDLDMILADDIVKAIKYFRGTEFNMPEQVVEALAIVRDAGYTVTPERTVQRGLKESKDFIDLCRFIARGRSLGQLNVWLVECQYKSLGDLLKAKLNDPDFDPEQHVCDDGEYCEVCGGYH